MLEVCTNIIWIFHTLIHKKTVVKMMQEPIFLQPVMKERIWGGTRLKSFGYDLPSDRTGECWGIAAHPHGTSVVKNGRYAGLDLRELWQKHRNLFGEAKGDDFPLLTKILDARQDLSIQVHPDDTYAQKVENEPFGKTECWYILDCDPGAEIVYGHTAATKEEFARKVQQQKWEELFQRRPIQHGDFFYVPSGTVHALCKGTMVLEIQQNSDLTYRIYDYDRVDQNGQKRTLHIDKALDVIRFPHDEPLIRPRTHHEQSTTITTYLEHSFFTVQKWETKGESSFVQTQNFLLVSVIAGQGKLVTEHETYSFQKGDHLILPYQLGRFTIQGETTWMVSYV